MDGVLVEWHGKSYGADDPCNSRWREGDPSGIGKKRADATSPVREAKGGWLENTVPDASSINHKNTVLDGVSARDI
jgi:hypothetical protein